MSEATKLSQRQRRLQRLFLQGHTAWHRPRALMAFLVPPATVGMERQFVVRVATLEQLERAGVIESTQASSNESDVVWMRKDSP